MREPRTATAPASNIRVAVVFGGRSSEHAISCVSAGSVIAALKKVGFSVVPIGIDQQGRWSIQAADSSHLAIHDGKLPSVTPSASIVTPMRSDVTSPSSVTSLADVDVVFPVLHGPWGEDGTIQGLLELANVPYVGSGVFASAAAMDKAHCKRILASHGISVVPSVLISRQQWAQDRDAVLAQCIDLGLPVFVKPARAGSSIGITKVTEIATLPAAIEAAAMHDPRVLVEAAVTRAREIEVGVIADPRGTAIASVPAEVVIRGDHDFYDFEAKYLDDAVDLIVPAELPTAVSEQVRAIACQVFDILGCEGLARVDFFIAADGSVLVNEVNTMPGFTSISLFPRMWAATDVDYPTLVNHLVRDALRRGTGLR